MRNVIEQLPADQLHARHMERAFPQGALRGRADASIAMEIAEPFTVFGIGEVPISPVVDLAVPVGVLLVPRKSERH